MGKLIAALIVIAVLVGGGVYYFSLVQKSQSTAPRNDARRTQPGSSTQPSVASNKVNMNNYKFFPETITVKAGESVTWANMDNSEHSATADDKTFDTGVFPQAESKTITFDEPGTYTYHCSLHPTMKGTVIVE